MWYIYVIVCIAIDFSFGWRTMLPLRHPQPNSPAIDNNEPLLNSLGGLGPGIFCNTSAMSPLKPPLKRSRNLLLLAAAVVLMLLGVGLQLQLPQPPNLRLRVLNITKLMAATMRSSSSAAGQLEVALASSSSSSSSSSSGATGQASTQQPEPAPDQASVLVTLMNSHWWTQHIGNDFTEPKCSSHGGTPLSCRFVSVSNNSELTSEAADELVSRADGLLYHIHPPAVLPAAARAGTPVVLNSLETPANYPAFANETLMRHVTLEYSYRTCAQVYQPYFTLPQTNMSELLFQPPEPFANKVDAVLYVNSNCGTKNGRHNIVRELRDLMVARRSKVQLHSYGRCDQNVGREEAERFAKLGGAGKIEFGRQYKLCIAMENSNDFDYVTEKVYQALQSGCIPIYYGAPNIGDYVPDVAGLVMVQQLGTVARLLDELERLATNETAYKEKMAWRSKPIEQQSPGFQRLHAMLRIPSGPCRLCKLLAEHRESPRNYTLCHANSTWQEALPLGSRRSRARQVG